MPGEYSVSYCVLLRDALYACHGVLWWATLADATTRNEIELLRSSKRGMIQGADETLATKDGTSSN